MKIMLDKTLLNQPLMPKINYFASSSFQHLIPLQTPLSLLLTFPLLKISSIHD
jgi:hypothetical protein